MPVIVRRKHSWHGQPLGTDAATGGQKLWGPLSWPLSMGRLVRVQLAGRPAAAAGPSSQPPCPQASSRACAVCLGAGWRMARVGGRGGGDGASDEGKERFDA